MIPLISVKKGVFYGISFLSKNDSRFSPVKQVLVVFLFKKFEINKKS